jgi:hypothetical protein
MKYSIKLKQILALSLLGMGIFTFQNQSFADSQTLDNINSTQVNKNNATTDVNGVVTRNDNTVDYFICLLIVVMTGKIARVIFALAIFAWGILFFMGKVTWQIFVVTSVGVALVFGSVAIVIAILPRATQVIDNTSGTPVIKTKTTSQLIREHCPEIGY